MTEPAHPPPDDASIIARSLTAPEEFAAIFDRHAPHIHRYLARRVGPQHADDLLGETFAAAFRRRGTYRVDRANARPWLYGMATHVVGQHHRDEARRYRLHAVALPDLPVEGPDDRAIASSSARLLRGQVGAALQALAQGDRDVLLLIAWEDLSYDEVAAALDIPVGTVRSRLHRARKQVRDALAPAFEETSHG
ncbi:RNA polymerase sigma factor [Labedaea rhizosphaerae]|uniref:RNA polymerase sigma-70 factor (ECF subfamily) n=1 Tax=Labedaea rhizosphaerae TaxID=598644 RepID=A0A4R6SNM8_LABRH|nr:RNA polymerase sigma factor [Labedaea rhizosphaerae]TDQ05012.1 RNA polymerase sigma-70 factor (ECF subfamily) [Labedaea rhizosphaerae]